MDRVHWLKPGWGAVNQTLVLTQMEKKLQLMGTLLRGLAQHRYFVPLCLLVALLIRLSWVALVDAQPVSDFRWYYERGIDLAAGRGYSMGPDAYWPENLPPAALPSEAEYPANGRPTAYWPVGYPAFLGLLFTMFGPSLFVAKLANILLYLGILLLAYIIARQLFRSELVGRMTLLVLVFYPNHIAYSSLLAGESLFLFLLMLAVALLLIAPTPRPWLFVTSGVIFGLACLVKPQAILAPALFFGASLITAVKRQRLSRRVAHFVLLYLALGLTILPWIIRNYRVFEDFVLISNNGGINLLVGNNPFATGAYGHHQQMAAMLSHVRGERDRDVAARAMAVDYMVNHPWETLERWPKKLWYLYRKDVEGISWNEQGMNLTQGGRGKGAMLALKVLAQGYYVLIVLAFLIMIILHLSEHRFQSHDQALPALGLWMALYFTLISLLTFGDTRFHFPVLPWVVMYAATLVEVLARPIQRRGRLNEAVASGVK
jgi:4-amino-4-deoxy-L-arabinose transferase-like glycosyltransferase